MKRINIDLLLVLLISVIVVILLLKVYKLKMSLNKCIETNTELGNYIETSQKSDSLIFFYINRHIPSEIILNNKNGLKKTINELSKESIFIYLSNIDCGPCVTGKLNIISGENTGLTNNDIIIFVQEVTPRELSLFAAVTNVPTSNIYIIENHESLFTNVVNSFIFTVSYDNRIQNLRDFNNLPEIEFENYARAFCKSIK